MENVARAIAERTAAAGVDVSVVTTRLPRRADAAGGAVPVRRCGAIEVAHTPIAPGLVPALLAAPAGAILHVHVGQPLVPEQAFLAARLRGLPYVAHFHLDVGPSGPLGVLLPSYKRAFLGPVLRRAARVVVYGPSQAGIVEARHGVAPDRIEAIPGGVDLPAAPVARPACDVETVLFVGRLSRQKNLPVLVEAVGLLAARGRATRLRIVGEGDEERAVRAAIRAGGLEGRAALLGRLEGERLSAELRAATVLALPSERESMGLVLVEAMAHGLPVVAADVPGIRDVVEDGRTGLLAPPEPRAFAAALERALSDAPLRATLAQGGLAAAPAFGWDRIVPRWLALYAAVAAERSPARSRA
jgi:glycosyltransferase involved in cell wall biosynthesis